MLRRKLLVGVLVAIFVTTSLWGMNSATHKVVEAQSDDTLQLAGLDAPVIVIYDQMGIPHIYADTVHDLFMAQGYIHSAHRWWQMEWWRHLSAGRLSEIAGDATIGNDKFLRTLDYQGAAEKDWEALSESAQAVLQAYTDGVNGYLADKTPADLAVEYQFLAMGGNHMEVEPWTIYDSLRWLKVMALGLSNNFETEIFRAGIVDAMGSLGARLILPNYPFDEKPVIVQPGGIDYTGMSDDATTMPIPDDLDFSQLNTALVGNISLDDPNISPLGSGVGIGSNSWVISGELTESGHAMVVNDPHLSIQMPSIWYEVGLHCNTVSDACPFNVVGVSFAGTPGVVIGHNDNIAWGFTNVGTDVQDLYILTINSDNPDQYLLDDEWVDFDIRTETLKVAGGDDVELNVYNSIWGPVLSDYLPVGEQVMALRWTAFDANHTLEALMHINSAQNWDEFRSAASMFDVPAQNMVYADVEGNIGYQMPGLTPIRAEGHQGTLPIDGSTTANAWQGYVPFDELPSIFNPEAGYIVTANNSVVPRDYPYYITDVWDYGQRAQRIETLIQMDEDGVYTIEDMQRIQGDNHDARADILMPALEALGLEGELGEAVAWLGEWDRQGHMDSPQAALFNMFWATLMEQSAADELGFTPDGGSLYIQLVGNFLQTPTHPIWNNQTTEDVVETRDDILKTSLEIAWNSMLETYGNDPQAWSWGDMHLAVFRAAPLGQGVDPQLDPMLNSLFNVTVRASGGAAIVNATGYDTGEGFELTSLPSMRQITIVGDWDSSLRINTLGQSGRPNSRHYKDQVDMWRTIDYHPEWFSREAVEADAEATWELVPAE